MKKLLIELFCEQFYKPKKKITQTLADRHSQQTNTLVVAVVASWFVEASGGCDDDDGDDVDGDDEDGDEDDHC